MRKRIVIFSLIIFVIAVILLSWRTWRILDLSDGDIERLSCEIIKDNDNNRFIKLSVEGNDSFKSLIEYGYFFSNIVIKSDGTSQPMDTYVNGISSDNLYQISNNYRNRNLVSIESYYKIDEGSNLKYLKVRATISDMPFVASSRKISISENCKVGY